MTAMQQIAEISCLARDAGMTYGAYISQFGSPFDAPVAVKKPKTGERRCKVCGEIFELERLADGQYSGKRICPTCTEKKKASQGKRKRNRAVKEYVTRCSRCNRLIITRRPPGKRKDFCAECRPLAKKEWRDEHDGKQ